MSRQDQDFNGNITSGNELASDEDPLIPAESQHNASLIRFPEAAFLLLKNGWPFLLTRGIELGTDFWTLSMLSQIGPDSASAATLIFSSKILLRSINATYLMFAPYVITQKINSGDSNQVGAVMFHNKVIATGLTLISIPLVLFSESIFRGLNQPAEAARIASEYLRFFLPGLCFTLYYISDQQSCLGLEYNKMVLLITLPVKGLSTFFGYGFMFGKFGLLKLDENGLAIANSIAAGFGCAAFLSIFAFHKNFKAFDIFRPRLKNSWPILKCLLSKGSGIFSYASIELGSVLMASLLIGSTGKANLAAAQPALQFAAITANLAFAFGQTSAIQMKQKMSASPTEEVHFQSARRIGYLAFGMAEILPLLLLIAYAFMRKQMVLLFLDSTSAADQALVGMAELCLLINLIGQVADTSRNIMGACLRAYGDTSFPMAINILFTLLINFPIALTTTLAFDAGPDITLIARNAAIFMGGLVLLNQFRMRSNQFDMSPPESLSTRIKTTFHNMKFFLCDRQNQKQDSVPNERSALLQ